MAYVLANHLVELGHFVHVVCVDKELDAEYEENGVLITRIHCDPRWGLKMFEEREQFVLPKLLSDHETHQYDIVHDVGGFLYFTVLKQFTILTGVPLISHLLILMKPFLEAIKFDAYTTRMFDDLQMLQCRFSANIIVTSLNDMYIIRHNKDLRKRDIHLIYNAIDIPQVDEASIKKWKATLPQDEMLFMIGARVNDKNKGVPCAVQFIDHLNAQGIRSKQVVTDPSEPANVSFGSENVIYLGRLDEKDYYSLMAAIDVSICAAKYEAFGLVAIESAYFNKPVIATCTGIYTEVVESVIDGLLVDQYDLVTASPRLVQFVKDIIARPKNNDAFGNTPEAFTREFWTAQILERYYSILSQKTGVKWQTLSS